MNRSQYDQYRAEVLPVPDPIIRADELVALVADPYKELTLLCYGYTVDRHSVYVLLDPDRGIGRLIDVDHQVLNRADHTDLQWSEAALYAEWHHEWPADDLVPSKRAYPQVSSPLTGPVAVVRHDQDMGLVHDHSIWVPLENGPLAGTCPCHNEETPRTNACPAGPTQRSSERKISAP